MQKHPTGTPAKYYTLVHQHTLTHTHTHTHTHTLREAIFGMSKSLENPLMVLQLPHKSLPLYTHTHPHLFPGSVQGFLEPWCHLPNQPTFPPVLRGTIVINRRRRLVHRSEQD